VAQRGDVLVALRQVGFGVAGAVERFVVLQADPFNAALDTLIVAPLDDAFAFYAQFPGALPVSGREAGVKTDQVVVVSHLAAVDAGRFQPSPVGKIDRRTLGVVEALLKRLFSLQ
jgi:mRNA-degrading endonuclease toxin of MazEF toxin-antitoxin module